MQRPQALQVAGSTVNEFWQRIWASAIAVLITIGLIVVIEQNKDDDDSIPKPPVGYHYCTNEDGTELLFCRNRR